ncbi:ABC transporter substrate-binding protein [Bosea sp. (in: a-proteobacteria)]|jgi:ABC-type branched-subunit amino acid transport system substrate-binding protein|uniref:ABC transporter substrate-binding protein n=1 Tax=Bosea sp. (in: a-proteobacteria) TaxID=1871050 RepID=UPI0025BBE7D7|nr:ABC transporter substrate-binding protein [Bosea sp. (in: a-proteobacteria)]MBR3191428.1 ABC transporter substrate-binding protein [Bosea sp. (in: a-proteobacteria)]
MAAVAACALIAAGGTGQAQEKLKIGVLATLSGALTSGGEDGVRGAQIALKQRGGKIAGREVEFIIAATDASPDSALRAARKLVEQDKVQLILGPLSGSEGIAMRDYSKTVPNVTVVDASSGALETTYVNPSPNYFRFNSNGAMWMAGLGEYVFKDKGYKKLAVIGEDYSFPYTQVFGFALGYCKAGGQIVQRQWVPLGTKDFGSVIANIPDDVDAVFLGLGGGDAVNFLNQYGQTGGKAKFVGGSIMVDQTVLSSRGAAKKLLVGTPSSGGVADAWDDPKWKAWVKAYQDAFPADKRFASPSLFATNYYNAFNGMATGLEKVNADLSDGGAKFRAELAKVELDAPNGPIKLDDDRQAIATTFITEVVEAPNGELTNKFVRTVPNVSKTMGLSADAFKAVGLPSRTNPECKP